MKEGTHRAATDAQYSAQHTTGLQVLTDECSRCSCKNSCITSTGYTEINAASTPGGNRTSFSIKPLCTALINDYTHLFSFPHLIFLFLTNNKAVSSEEDARSRVCSKGIGCILPRRSFHEGRHLQNFSARKVRRARSSNKEMTACSHATLHGRHLRVRCWSSDMRGSDH